ncbi:MAG TPA: glutamate synthase-related protein [Terriglobales bacterium]|jgi:glutamate synthase domain-containing protein 2|nr:glutamate synthase-related protein [Terriglobales bacterium]
MTFTRLNASAATLTKNRTEDSISPFSGMCATCVDGCIGMCEIGKSAYRGAEMIYPQPFGIITTASQKDYPVDLSHFTILGRAAGAWGIEEDSNRALFPAVDLETTIGADNGIRYKLPFTVAAMGSTNVAKNNWPGLAVGAAITGTGIAIGENVVGMDMDSKFDNGKVISSSDLEWRIQCFREWQTDGYGEVFVQANVEDTMLGVQEYAIKKLGVKVVELKWGQGAKDIGGEVKIKDLAKAQELHRRGYVVLPNPTNHVVIEAFKKGAFHEFERHSRVGMVTKDGFLKRVEELRKAGAKWITLKTGAYRPVDLARAVKFASLAKLDLLTVDAAGGGTGMSPWRMMNEWGIPGIELHSMLRQYCDELARKGEYVPPIALAGGFTFEDQIFKGFALCAPYVKMIAWARSPLAAAMVAKNIGKAIEGQSLPIYVERFGTTVDEIFVTSTELREKYGDRFNKLPTGAIGFYTYYQRVAQGLRQLMAGARKFACKYIDRTDIAALTPDAARISGIPLVTDVDKEEAAEVLAL